MARRSPIDQYGLFLVDRHTNGRVGLLNGLMALVRRVFGGMSQDDMYSDAANASAAAAIAGAVRTAQVSTANLTVSYLDAMARSGGFEPPKKVDPIGEHLRGIPSDEEWLRPFQEYRRQRAAGLDESGARLRMVERAEKLASDDLTMGMREATRNHAKATPKVVGYRRVVHPELAVKTGRVCGLCLVASDRLYSVKTLLPIHTGCNCTVAEVFSNFDPGNSLNNLSLGELYSAAGSTAAGDLIKVKYVIREHGELGTVLVNADHAFRGPSETAELVSKVA